MLQNKIHPKNLVTDGESLKKAQKVLIALHGRGGSAHDILSLGRYLKITDFALLAPQASNHSWYPYSFLAPPSQNEPWLTSALSLINEVVEDVKSEGIEERNIYFMGFSQGACLMLEFVARNAARFGGAIAFTGGLIGDRIYTENYKGDFGQMPVFIGSSDPDPHVPVERVRATTTLLQSMNAAVTTKIYDNMGHTISQPEIDLANQVVFP